MDTELKNIRIIDSGKANASSIMAKDAQLLENLSGHHAILHLYEWEASSATYGYFIDPYQYLNSSAIQQSQLQLAKRPTGGGIIFHLCDFAFSLLLPSAHPAFTVNTLENYAFVNQIVADAVQRFSKNSSAVALLQKAIEPLDSSCSSFCLAAPTIHDIMIAGRKVGGGAQRRKRQGLLHQGTVSMGTLSEETLAFFLQPNTQVIKAMMQNSFSFLGSAFTTDQLVQAKQEFRVLLIDAVNQNI